MTERKRSQPLYSSNSTSKEEIIEIIYGRKRNKKLVSFLCSLNLYSYEKILLLYGRQKNYTFVVFFKQFMHLKENLHYYHPLDVAKKTHIST